jgi:hypothetical protein
MTLPMTLLDPKLPNVVENVIVNHALHDGNCPARTVHLYVNPVNN